MVVARHHQHAAVRRRAVGVAVLERVARAVDARPLAVPQREDALDGRGRDWLSTCCEPSTAVAARSSLTAGRNSIRFSFEELPARQSSRSKPPSGEPR